VKRVAVIHHLSQPFLGHAEPPLRDVELVEHTGTLPPLDGIDGIVSFGGIESVLDGGLEAEAQLMRSAVAADVPVIGVCLGAQLLAHALGGKVVRRPRRMVAWVPLVGEWEGYGLHWNEDGFEPPPGAVELLQRPDGFCEAFRALPRGAAAARAATSSETSTAATTVSFIGAPSFGTGFRGVEPSITPESGFARPGSFRQKIATRCSGLRLSRLGTTLPPCGRSHLGL